MDILAVDFRANVGERKFLLAATTQSDGTFSVGGSDGKGIPRGQYRITVLHAGPEGHGGDKFKGHYAAEKTPLIVDITESTSLTVDLGARTVTK
jgi:hypothetical protein